MLFHHFFKQLQHKIRSQRIIKFIITSEEKLSDLCALVAKMF